MFYNKNNHIKEVRSLQSLHDISDNDLLTLSLQKCIGNLNHAKRLDQEGNHISGLEYIENTVYILSEFKTFSENIESDNQLSRFLAIFLDKLRNILSTKVFDEIPILMTKLEDLIIAFKQTNE